MNSERIKEIQQATAYPESVSVQQALLQVWNECESEHNRIVEELKAEIQMLKDYCNDLPRDKQIKPNSDWGY
jgi:hypothetical protein